MKVSGGGGGVLLLAAAVATFLGVCLMSPVEELRNQEQLLLNSLGLSERPRPAAAAAAGGESRRRVPSALWRMFRRSESIKAQESEPCMLSEYGVRGNTIRFVQDQGRLFRTRPFSQKVAIPIHIVCKPS